MSFPLSSKTTMSQNSRKPKSNINNKVLRTKNSKAYKNSKASRSYSHTVLSRIRGFTHELKNQNGSVSRSISLEAANVARDFMNIDQIYPLRLGAYTTVTATGVTGTINSYFNFSDLIQLSPDWTSIANVFDACVLDSIAADWVPLSQGFNVAQPTATGIAFDDDAGFTPNSYNTIVSYTTSEIFCPCVQGSTLTTEANSTGFRPAHTSYRRPFRDKDNEPVSDTPTTGWIKTSDPSQLTGSMLVYNSAVSATSNINCYQCFLTFSMRFRFAR